MSAIDREELTLNLGTLCRQEEYTDTMAGSIKKLIPVKADGSLDDTRPLIFIGQTSIMLSSGPVPVQAVLAAENLEDAIKAFPATMEKAINELADRLIKLAEEQQSLIQKPDSNIIIPGM